MQPGQGMNVDAAIRIMELQIALMKQVIDAREAKLPLTVQLEGAEIGLLQIQYENAARQLEGLRMAKDQGLGSPIIPPSALGFKQ